MSRKLLILVLFAISCAVIGGGSGAVIGYFYARSLPEVYAASVVLKINGSSTNPFQEATGHALPKPEARVMEFVASDGFLNAVITEQGIPLQALDAAYFREFILVRPYRNTRLVELMVRAAEPDLAVLMANGLARAIVMKINQEEQLRLSVHLETLLKEIHSQQQVLESAEKRLEAIRKTGTAGEIKLQEQEVASQRSLYQLMLDRAANEKISSDTRIAAAEIINEAQIPAQSDARAFKQPVLKGAVSGSLLGLVIGILLCFARILNPGS